LEITWSSPELLLLCLSGLWEWFSRKESLIPLLLLAVFMGVAGLLQPIKLQERWCTNCSTSSAGTIWLDNSCMVEDNTCSVEDFSYKININIMMCTVYMSKQKCIHTSAAVLYAKYSTCATFELPTQYLACNIHLNTCVIQYNITLSQISRSRWVWHCTLVVHTVIALVLNRRITVHYNVLTTVHYNVLTTVHYNVLTTVHYNMQNIIAIN